jgi:hypothetical protein
MPIEDAGPGTRKFGGKTYYRFAMITRDDVRGFNNEEMTKAYSKQAREVEELITQHPQLSFRRSKTIYDDIILFCRRKDDE